MAHPNVVQWRLTKCPVDKTSSSKNSPTRSSLSDIWKNDAGATFVVAVVENSDSMLGRQLILDVSQKIRDLSVPIVVRRVVADTEIGRAFLHESGIEDNRRFPGKILFLDVMART